MHEHPIHGAASGAASCPTSDTDLLREVLRLLGGDVAALTPTARVPMAMRRLAEGVTLVHEGAPLHSLHVVRSGSLKCVRSLEDGYQQVTALALPGDVLGFEGLHTGHCAATHVALEFSTVYALPLSSLHALRVQCPALDDAWQRAISRQFGRTAATADMLAAVASEARLARFLLWLSTRAAESGWSPRRLHLSMCRRDIASLLGVANETVSRSFTAMVDAGLLSVNNRDIDILDLALLRARARTTRRPADSDTVGVAVQRMDGPEARHAR